MPIYEYECQQCGKVFETIRKFSDPRLTECLCEEKAPVTKLISAAAFHLKGTGWYVTDFRDKGGKGSKDGEKEDKGDGSGDKEGAGGGSSDKKGADGGSGGKDTASGGGKDGTKDGAKSEPPAKKGSGGESKPAAAD